MNRIWLPNSQFASLHGQLRARRDAKGSLSLRKVKFVVILKEEYAVVAYLNLAAVNERNEGVTLVSPNRHFLKDRELARFHFFPHIVPRLKFYLPPGDHFSNRKAFFLCLGKDRWKSTHQEKERKTDKIDESFVCMATPHLYPLLS